MVLTKRIVEGIKDDIEEFFRITRCYGDHSDYKNTPVSVNLHSSSDIEDEEDSS
jgi:hypothetical protein